LQLNRHAKAAHGHRASSRLSAASHHVAAPPSREDPSRAQRMRSVRPFLRPRGELGPRAVVRAFNLTPKTNLIVLSCSRVYPLLALRRDLAGQSPPFQYWSPLYQASGRREGCSHERGSIYRPCWFPPGLAERSMLQAVCAKALSFLSHHEMPRPTPWQFIERSKERPPKF
jgi:hypothetical protein